MSPSLKPRLACLLLAAPALGACESTSAPTGPTVAINIAPLALPSVVDACYRLTVTNATPETVWQQASVCADVYGDGKSAITYIGTCDASLVNGLPQKNSVTLEIEDLYEDILGVNSVINRASYQNPCGHTSNGNNDGFGPCVLTFDCLENKDVLVEFNLTVMRDAKQGFFDIAVNFEDIFCSAKLDSCYEPGKPIELLHGEDGRQHTMVGAIACSAGTGTRPEIVLVQPVVVCTLQDDSEITFALELGSATGGNAKETVVIVEDEGEIPTTVTYSLDFAVYFGSEDLSCGVGDDDEPISCGKAYYNLAINIGALAGQGPEGKKIESCQFYYGASATEVGSTTFSVDGTYADSAGVYPWISFNGQQGIELVADGQSKCFTHALNGDDSDVTTAYMKGDAYGGGYTAPLFAYRTRGDVAVGFTPAEQSVRAPDGTWDCYKTTGNLCRCCGRLNPSDCHDGRLGFNWFGLGQNVCVFYLDK